MRPATLVERLYARHAAGLPFLPVSGGAEGDAAPDPAAAAAAQAPDPAANQVAATAAVAKPQLVTVAADEFAQYLEAKRRLSELEAEKESQVQAAEDARLKALAAKGESEKAFSELKERTDRQVREAKTRADSLELEILSGCRDREVSATLLGKEFKSPAAAAQVRQLLEPRFEAVRDAAGRPVVRERGTGRSPAEVVNEALASADFAHFVPAPHKGGAGATGADTARPRPDDGKPVPFDVNMVEVLRARKSSSGQAQPYGLAMPYSPAGNGRNN